jgi:hypothetical protein
LTTCAEAGGAVAAEMATAAAAVSRTADIAAVNRLLMRFTPSVSVARTSRSGIRIDSTRRHHANGNHWEREDVTVFD